MSAYIIRRILFMIPTMFGIMLVAFVVVQFAPGGPVEQVIAKLTGAETGASSRISGSAGGDFGSAGRGEGGRSRAGRLVPCSGVGGGRLRQPRHGARGLAGRRGELEVPRCAGPRPG